MSVLPITLHSLLFLLYEKKNIVCIHAYRERERERERKYILPLISVYIFLSVAKEASESRVWVSFSRGVKGEWRFFFKKNNNKTCVVFIYAPVIGAASEREWARAQAFHLYVCAMWCLIIKIELHLTKISLFFCQLHFREQWQCVTRAIRSATRL